jgi:hypothetical protein
MLRIAVILLLAATTASAHEPDIGPNGGKRLDAGPYRVELTPVGTRVDVHVTYDDDSAVDTAAMTGTAMLVIEGKPVRVTLAPAAPGVLSGEAGATVPADVKGAVQVVGADGVTQQAKF